MNYCAILGFGITRISQIGLYMFVIRHGILLLARFTGLMIVVTHLLDSYLPLSHYEA